MFYSSVLILGMGGCFVPHENNEKALIFIGILLQKRGELYYKEKEVMRSFTGFCVIDNTRGLLTGVFRAFIYVIVVCQFQSLLGF